MQLKYSFGTIQSAAMIDLDNLRSKVEAAV
jgi:hypothetical protein